MKAANFNFSKDFLIYYPGAGASKLNHLAI
jgi:hypothetical protein